MFGAKQECTVVAAGMRIVGNVTAEGTIQVNGQTDGEIQCTSLIIARGGRVSGMIAADNIVVDGMVEGPIQAVDVVLKAQAHVVGDIACKSVAEHVIVDGRVEGPILGGDVVLKSQAHVVGDIACESVIIEKGAFIEGRLVRSRGANGRLSVVEPANDTEPLLTEGEQMKRKAVVDARHGSAKSEFAH